MESKTENTETALKTKVKKKGGLMNFILMLRSYKLSWEWVS